MCQVLREGAEIQHWVICHPALPGPIVRWWGKMDKNKTLMHQDMISDRKDNKVWRADYGEGGTLRVLSKKGSLMGHHLNQDLKTMRDKSHRGLWEDFKMY